ncbi:MAG: hypothetical protein BWY64_01771 [bacterium ADurb.Bin363]|nr:MAG: hypothetical protein BWY64_01771 [bacterium ADurb.Bin363]
MTSKQELQKRRRYSKLDEIREDLKEELTEEGYDLSDEDKIKYLLSRDYICSLLTSKIDFISSWES